MAHNRTAILLLNVGSPDTPQTKDVRRYLSRFLNDKRVIDMPYLLRQMLVNFIIVPFRAPKSAKLYKLLWTEKGFPLAHYAQQVKDKFQTNLGTENTVFVGMSYGNPLIKDTLRVVEKGGFNNIVIVPLFPQYASSSSGAAIEKVLDVVKRWTVIPEIRIVGEFYSHPSFIKAFAECAKYYNVQGYDHIIFSYHGLPMRHLQQMCASPDCANCNCEQGGERGSGICYKAACYETTRLIAGELGIDDADYSIGFQSHMSAGWMQPFTDKLIIANARKGNKKLLVVAPSFVADCLETTVEIGITYAKLFKEHGGVHLDLVDSLNDSPLWIHALTQIVKT